MRVLLAMYYTEATWSTDHWHTYGISESDKKKINAEFFRFKNRFEKKMNDKSDAENQETTAGT